MSKKKLYPSFEDYQQSRIRRYVMKQTTKQNRSISRSLKQVLANRTRRALSIMTLIVLTLTLTVLVWAKPSVVKRYLGLGAAQPQQVNVSLTLRSNGFDPMSIQHSAGSFTLSINNQTDSSAVTLHLYRSNGECVREISIGSGATGWSDAVSLSTGNYTLVAPDNPAWTCHFDIQ
jgi:hypothetical protein